MNRKKILSAALVLSVALTVMCGAAVAENKGGKNNGNQEKLQTRIDFGNAYITGQSLKSGAVYLLQRKKSEINSMLKYREHYREEIMDCYNLDTGNITEGMDNPSGK